METFLVYLLKSALLSALFYGLYRLVLERETFHQSKRLFLMGGIFTACILPWITYTRTVKVTAVTNFSPLQSDISAIAATQIQSWKPADLLAAIYFIGLAIFLIKFFMELYALYSILRSGQAYDDRHFTHVRHRDTEGPFSFFSYLVYDPERYNDEELELILIHEKVHASQLHSLDILISRLFCIFQWWNPLAWIYNKSIKANLEYIADQHTSAKPGKLRTYQYLLLKNCTPKNLYSLSSPLFSSSIKKRISMLHTHPSQPIKQWKLSLILPFLAAFFFLFNVKTIAQAEMVEVELSEEIYAVSIDKNATDADLKKEAELFATQGITLVFDNIQRNDAGEIIGIASSYKAESGASGNYSVLSEDPIETFTFYVKTANGKKRMGYGKPEVPLTASEAHKRGAFFIKEVTKGEVETIELHGEHLAFFDGDETKFEADSITFTIEMEDDKEGMKRIITKDGNGKKMIIVTEGTAPEGMKWNQLEENGEVKTINIETITETEEVNGEKIVKVITKTTNAGEAKEMTVTVEQSEEKAVKIITDDSKAKPIFVIDGEEKGADFEMNSIDPNDIESINVWKGEKAIEKYGEKAKNGVIEITTKKK